MRLVKFTGKALDSKVYIVHEFEADMIEADIERLFITWLRTVPVDPTLAFGALGVDK